MTVSLTKYEAARAALAECRTIDEVKDIRDKAEALRAYARQAKNRSMEVDAAEIRIRAERRLGELLRLIKRRGHLSVGGRPSNKQSSKIPRATLREANIDRKLSARSQRLAEVLESKFESDISRWREKSLNVKGRVTPGIIEPPDVRLPIRKRKKVLATLFHFNGGDIRNWNVSELRRAAASFAAITEHIGPADAGAKLGDCISDTKLAALMGLLA